MRNAADNSLLRRFRISPLIVARPTCRENVDGSVTIATSWGTRLTASAVFAVFGAGATWLSFVDPPKSSGGLHAMVGTFLHAYGWLIGPLFVILGLRLAMLSNSLHVGRNGAPVRINWSNLLHRQQLTLPAVEYELVLRKGGPLPHGVALYLRRQTESFELMICFAQWREKLLPIFLILKRVFGKLAHDDTVAKSVIPAKRMAFVTAPMKVNNERGVSRRIRFSRTTAKLLPSSGNIWLSYTMCAFSCGLIIYGWLRGQEIGWGFQSITPITFGFMLIVMAYVILTKRESISLDGGITVRQFKYREGTFSVPMVPVSQIAAVQICPNFQPGEHVSQIPLPGYNPTQLNLILHSPPEGRIHLLTDTNQERITTTAADLARFLSVEVLDHRDVAEVLDDEE